MILPLNTTWVFEVDLEGGFMVCSRALNTWDKSRHLDWKSISAFNFEDLDPFSRITRLVGIVVALELLASLNCLNL